MSKDPRHSPATPRRSGRPHEDETEAAAAEGICAPPEEIARYIAAFSAELSLLAKRSKFDLLAYLLDIATLEATQLAQQETGR
jgi:hypothetical protein